MKIVLTRKYAFLRVVFVQDLKPLFFKRNGFRTTFHRCMYEQSKKIRNRFYSLMTEGAVGTRNVEQKKKGRDWGKRSKNDGMREAKIIFNQNDCKSLSHVRENLREANKCWYILSTKKRRIHSERDRSSL